MDSQNGHSEKKYSKDDKFKILKYILVHGRSEESLNQMKIDLKITTIPALTTITTRWRKNTPCEELRCLIEEIEKDGEIHEDMVEWVNDVKGKEDDSLTFKAFYKCFHMSFKSLIAEAKKRAKNNLDITKKQTDEDTLRLLSACSTYANFIMYIFACEEYDVKSKQNILANLPYKEKAQTLFGENGSLNPEIKQRIDRLIRSCTEEKDHEAFVQTISNLVKQSGKDLDTGSSKHLQSVGEASLKSGQIRLLSEFAIEALTLIVWGEPVNALRINVSETTADLINSAGIPHDYLDEYLKIVLFEGATGKMGIQSFRRLVDREDINPLAAFELGEFYYYGTRIEPPNYEKAYEYYELSGKQGHPAGLWSAAYMLIYDECEQSHSILSKQERFRKAKDKLLAGDELGSPACAHALGQLYWRGQIVNDSGEFEPCDYKHLQKAEEYLLKSVGKGYKNSYKALGGVYQSMSTYGNTKECMRKAFEEYSKAAQYRDGYARNKLGQLWENGQGLEEIEGYDKRNEHAAEWYLKSLDVNKADEEKWSYVNCARVYSGSLKDCGVSKDSVKSVKYYQTACSLLEDDKYCKFMVGYLNAVFDCWEKITQPEFIQIAEQAIDYAERATQIYESQPDNFTSQEKNLMDKIIRLRECLQGKVSKAINDGSKDQTDCSGTRGSE